MPPTADVFVTRRLPEPGIRPLIEAGLSVECSDVEAPIPPYALVDGARGARAMITMVADTVDEAVLDAAQGLKVIANLGVGYDNIDVESARLRGIQVTNTPGVLAEATADLTWALILGTLRRVTEGDRLVRSGEWSGWAPTQLLGYGLHGRTLGLVGLGRIGGAVARRASGFGMSVIYHNRHRAAEEFGARYVSLDDVLSQSDVISLHAPLTATTRGMIGEAELQSMRSSAVLVNTARGGLVDQEALISALGSGAIAAAGMDVYEEEPTVPAALRNLPNTVLLPHLGSATVDTRAAMVELACANVIRVLAGEHPISPVT